MIWLHPALLIGLALTALPVLVHLLMRAKPKRLVFPALRLIENRRRMNVRRLRLRHVLLLLARMAVLSLLVLAVARPSVPAADYSLRAGDWLRLGIVAGLMAVMYQGFQLVWKRRQLAPHELVYRRSFLRTGLALGGLLLLGLLVAWPYQRRIAASITQPTLAASEFLPVVAVMVFDTSLSMQYRFENKTRLEAAQEIATRHLGGLPRGSRVAVADTTGDGPIRFQSDMSAAVKRIGELANTAVSRPLDDRLIAALEAQLEDQERTTAGREGQSGDLLREVYVFTDLAGTAWRREESPRLHEALTRAPEVSVYLIDIGVSSPSNLALTELALTEQSAPRGNEVTLRATLEATGGESGERVVELYVENDAGRLVKQGQQSPKVDPGGAAAALFALRATGGPVMQGEIRLAASDPLTFDDVRPFTLQVEPAAQVLIVSETQGDARYLLDVLSPPELVSSGRLRYRSTWISPGRLTTTDLGKYPVVCLVNVADPQPAGWSALAGYTEAGGSLLIVLGDRVKHAAYLAPAARDLLPGEPAARLKFDPPEFLDLQNLTHPVLKKFADWGTGALTSTPVREYWKVTPATRDTAVIARYTDHRQGAALIERACGQGRSMLFTTSLDRRWNDLPVADWAYLALVDQIMRYLTHSTAPVFNYVAGDSVSLAIDASARFPAYLLRKPGLQQLRHEIPPGASTIIVPEVDQLGNYRVTGIDGRGKFESGFSVAAPRDESQLARLTQDQLNARLGEERYSLARDIEHLQRNVRAGRLGREALPLVALLLLALFLGEHLFANRFHDAEPPPAEMSPPDRRALR